jgi:hypothetical protein
MGPIRRSARGLWNSDPGAGQAVLAMTDAIGYMTTPVEAPGRCAHSPIRVLSLAHDGRLTPSRRWKSLIWCS